MKKKKESNKNPFITINPDILPVGAERTAAAATIAPKAAPTMESEMHDKDHGVGDQDNDADDYKKETAFSVLKRNLAAPIETGFASPFSAARSLKAHIKAKADPESDAQEMPQMVQHGLPKPMDTGPKSSESPANPLLYDRLKAMMHRYK